MCIHTKHFRKCMNNDLDIHVNVMCKHLALRSDLSFGLARHGLSNFLRKKMFSHIKKNENKQIK